MTKLSFLLGVFVILSGVRVPIAFAMPAVGDQARFDQVTTQGASVMAAEFSEWLIATDSAQGFLKQTDIYYGGQLSDSQQEWVSVDELISDSNAADSLAHCAQTGGALETLTVPAGTFTACAFPISSGGMSGTLWMGQVPFGRIKLELFDPTTGQHQVTSLKAFHKG